MAKEYIWLVLAATLPFWRKYALGILGPTEVFGMRMNPGDVEAILLGVPILLTAPSILLWRPVVPRLGYRRAWILASFVFIPRFLLMTFARNFYTALLGTVLAAPGLAGSMIMPFPVLSEIVDDDAARHGYRREGIFFGMSAGIIKLAFSAQGVLFAAVMSACRICCRERRPAGQRGLGDSLPHRRHPHHRLPHHCLLACTNIRWGGPAVKGAAVQEAVAPGSE